MLFGPRFAALLTLLIAASAFARDEQVVYSRYQDGRPRLVVIARYVAFDEGEILLVRFADRAGAKGKIVDRYKTDFGGVGVTLLPLIDRKDVAVEIVAKHSV